MKIEISQKRLARQRGNALLEFALCSVLLLLVTVGVTDFARLFTVADMAANAAAAGTQYGSLSPAHYTDYTGMQKASLEDMCASCTMESDGSRMDSGNYTGATANASQTCYCQVGGSSVTCPADCTSGSPETYVTMQTSVPFTPTFSYPWIPTVLSVSGSSTVRVQ